MKNKIKIFFKLFLKYLLAINFIKKLFYVLMRIHDNDKYQLKVKNKNFLFTKSNALNEYRVNTFLTKEPETIEWINSFKKNKVFWDIGSNIGLYSLYAAMIPECKVYSFEPSVFNLEILARNINLNSQNKNITLIPISLSSNKSVSEFFCSSIEKSGALSSFSTKIDQNGKNLNSLFSYSTIGISMDDLIKFYNLDYPDYIKIDVDGNEHIILEGAKNSLIKCKSILLELSDVFSEQVLISEKILKENNFKLDSKFYKSNSQQSNQIWKKT